MQNVCFRLRTLSIGVVVAGLLVGPACSRDPEKRKQAFLQSGDKYFAAGQYRAAIIEYRNAVQIDQTFGPARARLAETYARNGDSLQAFQEYIRAADLMPKNVEVQFQAGNFWLAANRPQEALGRADIALKLAPNESRLHILRANALASLKQFDQAIPAIQQAIKLDPGHAFPYTQLGGIELMRNRRDAAEAAYKQAVAIEPKSVDAHLALGNFYWALGNAAETEAAYSAALKLDVNSQPANRAMAALAMGTGRAQEAEQYLKRLADTRKDANSIIELSDYYMLTGRPKDAIARLEPLSRQTPPPNSVPYRLARAYATAGDSAKAHAIVDGLTKKNARDAEALLLKGQMLTAEGRRDEGLAKLRAAVEANPSFIDAQFELGRQYAVRGDTGGAEAAFREILKINPQNPAAQTELARLNLAIGNAGESVRNADLASQINPGSLDARLTLIKGLIAANDLDRAERELAVVKPQFGNTAAVQALVGTLALQRKDLTAARVAFTRAQELEPNSLDGMAGLVSLELMARNNAAATAAVENRLRSSKPTPQLLVLGAATYLSTNDIAGAERLLRQAISLDASYLPAYGMLGQLYVSQQKLDQAREEFDQLARRQSKPIGAMTMSAVILQSQGNIPKAKERLQQILAIDPRAAVAANNLAWIYAESGENLDEALQLAQTATEVMPDLPDMMDTLGWVYYKKNLPQLAIPLFERSRDKVPDNAMYRYHLGLARLARGDKREGDIDKARVEFERALKLSPDAETAAGIRTALNQTPAAAGRN